jgi:hypothetical protein
MELSGDLPHRPFLDPVQAVNVVDLFRREHRQILIYTGRTSLYGQNVTGTRTLFFTTLRQGGGNSLKNQDFRKSYVVLYKIGRFRPNKPNLCCGTL